VVAFVEAPLEEAPLPLVPRQILCQREVLLGDEGRPSRSSSSATAVGRGKVALRDNLRAELKLIESKTLANGVVVVSYEPIRT